MRDSLSGNTPTWIDSIHIGVLCYLLFAFLFWSFLLTVFLRRHFLHKHNRKFRTQSLTKPLLDPDAIEDSMDAQCSCNHITASETANHNPPPPSPKYSAQPETGHSLSPATNDGPVEGSNSFGVAVTRSPTTGTNSSEFLEVRLAPCDGPIGVRFGVSSPLQVKQTLPLPDGRAGPLEGQVPPGAVLMSFNAEDASKMSLQQFKQQLHETRHTWRLLVFRSPPSLPSQVSRLSNAAKEKLHSANIKEGMSKLTHKLSDLNLKPYSSTEGSDVFGDITSALTRSRSKRASEPNLSPLSYPPPREYRLVEVLLPPGPIGARMAHTVPLKVRELVPREDGSASPLTGLVKPGATLYEFGHESAVNMNMEEFKLRLAESRTSSLRLVFKTPHDSAEDAISYVASNRESRGRLPVSDVETRPKSETIANLPPHSNSVDHSSQPAPQNITSPTSRPPTPANTAPPSNNNNTAPPSQPTAPAPMPAPAPAPEPTIDRTMLPPGCCVHMPWVTDDHHGNQCCVCSGGILCFNTRYVSLFDVSANVSPCIPPCLASLMSQQEYSEVRTTIRSGNRQLGVFLASAGFMCSGVLLAFALWWEANHSDQRCPKTEIMCFDLLFLVVFVSMHSIFLFAATMARLVVEGWVVTHVNAYLVQLGLRMVWRKSHLRFERF
eukprot:c12731_g1_i1.p1 GENE.c12731_g1_i1~~c12731_g1_i1.p1  ORF type:complete len:704 (-),score=119.67 c12731_g1_i1:2689-4680(-)